MRVCLLERFAGFGLTQSKMREIFQSKRSGLSGSALVARAKQAAAETQESPDKGGLSNFLTGADRKVPGVDELNPDKVFGGPFNMENFKTSAGTLMTFDDDAQKNIWDEQLSSAGVEHRWEQDPFGNAVLVYKDEDGEEQMGYLNKPGVSGRDIAATGAQVGGLLVLAVWLRRRLVSVPGSPMRGCSDAQLQELLLVRASQRRLMQGQMR